MNDLPVCLAHELAQTTEDPSWLVEGLWGEQAVGILGGEPKCCKSFLALDLAVSVASATACMRHFHVPTSGTVLLFPAEDALDVVHRRLRGICAAAQLDLTALPIHVITASRLLLDTEEDRRRLRQTVDRLRPRLLILDPFIRLHLSDENASKEVAPLLGYLRELQRDFRTAVLLVHHARKGGERARPGQALRGSSDLHGWGDSNLYVRRRGSLLSLTVEHRAAPGTDDIPLLLSVQDSAVALSVQSVRPPPATPSPPPPAERVLNALDRVEQPASIKQLRKVCRIRTATLCETLSTLCEEGRVRRDPEGYRRCTFDPFPVSAATIGPEGNGNGKQPLAPRLPGETEAGHAGTQPAEG